MVLPADPTPVPGEMYWVDTELVPGRDPKPRRPVVVLYILDAVDRVSVCTRTTQREDGSGVHHPADPDLGLSKEGWFRRRWFSSIDLSMFVEPNVERRGVVSDELLQSIQAEVA